MLNSYAIRGGKRYETDILVCYHWWLVCIATNPLSAELLDDAVGIWLFDEGKGGVAADTSGNGNDGEITGAKWAEGKFGDALEFEPPPML